MSTIYSVSTPLVFPTTIEGTKRSPHTTPPQRPDGRHPLVAASKAATSKNVPGSPSPEQRAVSLGDGNGRRSLATRTCRLPRGLCYRIHHAAVGGPPPDVARSPKRSARTVVLSHSLILVSMILPILFRTIRARQAIRSRLADITFFLLDVFDGFLRIRAALQARRSHWFP